MKGMGGGVVCASLVSGGILSVCLKSAGEKSDDRAGSQSVFSCYYEPIGDWLNFRLPLGWSGLDAPEGICVLSNEAFPVTADVLPLLLSGQREPHGDGLVLYIGPPTYEGATAPPGSTAAQAYAFTAEALAANNDGLFHEPTDISFGQMDIVRGEVTAGDDPCERGLIYRMVLDGHVIGGYGVPPLASNLPDFALVADAIIQSMTIGEGVAPAMVPTHFRAFDETFGKPVTFQLPPNWSGDYTAASGFVFGNEAFPIDPANLADIQNGALDPTGDGRVVSVIALTADTAPVPPGSSAAESYAALVDAYDGALSAPTELSSDRIDVVRGEYTTAGDSTKRGLRYQIALDGHLFSAQADAPSGVNPADLADIVDPIILSLTLPPDLLTAVSARPDLTLWMELLEKTGLADTLTGGTYTMFAPSDLGFQKYMKLQGMTREELLAHPELRSILQRHIVAGEYTTEKLMALKGQALPTLADGSELPVGVEDATNYAVEGDLFFVNVNGATVCMPDVHASNGIVHTLSVTVVQ
jgi:uncharacterized surface protein with fasciclin (FAS1) repeats